MKKLLLILLTLFCIVANQSAFAAYPTTTEHHKVYPYTSIMASPYSGDPTGAIDCAAAIESIKANQSNVGTIYIPTGVFKIATNLTIPAGMTLDFAAGAYFSVSSGITLTVNGPIKTPFQQIFACVGTGTITLSVNVPVVYPQWFGAVGNGTTDDKAALKMTFSAAAAGSTVSIPKTTSTYKFINTAGLTDAITIDKALLVELQGTIKSTSSANQVNPPYIFNVTGTGVTFQGPGTLQGPGTYIVDEATADNRPGLIRIAANYCSINRVNFIDPPSCSIYVRDIDYTKIDRCNFTGGCLVLAATSAQYFHIYGEGGYHNTITNNHFYMDANYKSVRSFICWGSTTQGENLFITNNQMDSPHEHGTYLWVNSSTFVNNACNYQQTTITDQLGCAFKMGGLKNQVIGNKAINCVLGGFAFYTAQYCIIEANLVYDFGNVAFLISDTDANTTGFNYNKIRNNIAVAYTGADGRAIGNGIRYTGATNTTHDCIGGEIVGNTIISAGSVSSSTDAAIYVAHENSTYHMSRMKINDNLIETPVRYGVYLNYVTNSELSRNMMYNPKVSPGRMFVTNTSTNLVMDGNILRDDQTPALATAMIYSDATTLGIELINSRVVTTANAAILGVNSARKVMGRGNRMSDSDPLKGIFTINGVATKDIANTNVYDTGLTYTDLFFVNIIPLNSHAVDLMASAKAIHIESTTANVGFQVKTADGNAAPATDAYFAYEIVQ
jgi:hypothetical protein